MPALNNLFVNPEVYLLSDAESEADTFIRTGVLRVTGLLCHTV